MECHCGALAGMECEGCEKYVCFDHYEECNGCTRDFCDKCLTDFSDSFKCLCSNCFKKYKGNVNNVNPDERRKNRHDQMLKHLLTDLVSPGQGNRKNK